MGFRKSRSVTAVLAVLLTALATGLLAGCVPSDPIVTPAPEASSTPVFATDEDALAAASAAYAKYLEVSDAITSDGGERPDRMKDLVTAGQFQTELGDFQQLSNDGITTIGQSAFEFHDLQQYQETGKGEASLSVYVCLDVSAVRVIDGSGNDVTPVDRPERLPLEVGFQISTSPVLKLLISRSEVWSGTDFCG